MATAPEPSSYEGQQPMQVKMRRKFLRSIAGLMVGVLFVLLIVPLALYQHSIGLLDTMPTKAETELPKEEADKLWAANEDFKPDECASITPYWLYRWLVVAIINDYITRMQVNSAYSNVSKMASRIAIYHMRQGHFHGKGMLWWHITHAFLGIWLQRNWSTSEIVAKYKAINA